MGAPLSALLEDISVPEIGVPDVLSQAAAEAKDIFAPKVRKGWNADAQDEARCDFAPDRNSIGHRGVLFAAVWRKSVKGRTLSDVKKDDDMVPFFAENIALLIRDFCGSFLRAGDYAVVTTPPRRHRTRNFGERVAEAIAAILDVDFYSECAHAPSRQRVGAVFTPLNIPKQQNVIVVDDIVTTGSTFIAMKNLLTEHGKNCMFFAGINNKM